MVIHSRPRYNSIFSPAESSSRVSPMADPSQEGNDNLLRRGTVYVSHSRRHHPRQIFPPPPSTEANLPGEADQPPISSSFSVAPNVPSPLATEAPAPGLQDTPGIAPTTVTSAPTSPPITSTSRKVVTVSASPFRPSSSTVSSAAVSTIPTQSSQTSNLLKQPQFLIGVACGGAAFVGILVGLIVCCVRCRRRRRQKLRISAPIPWNSRLDSEFGPKHSFDGSSYYPKSSYTYSNDENSFKAEYDPIIYGSVGTYKGYRGDDSSLGPLQITNLAPGDKSAGSSRASSVLDVPINNEPGTPRELVPGGRPRFLGISGRGLSWAGQRGEPIVTPHQAAISSWPRLPTPSPYGAYHSRNPVPEVWTTSLKRSISTALSSLTSGWVPPPEVRDPQASDTYLTPMPVRQFTGRYPDTSLPTPHGSLSAEYLLGTSIPSHPGVLTTATRSHPGSDTERTKGAYAPHPPLIATMRPLRSACSMRTDLSARLSLSRGQYPGKVGNNEIHSSASSVYSQSSAPSSYSQPSDVNSELYKPSASRQSSQETVRRKPGLSTVQEDERLRSPSSERPSVISRTSSSGCSVNSYYFSSNSSVSTVTGGQGIVEMDRSAHSALIDRRRKARKVV